jgi:hypothetical protein
MQTSQQGGPAIPPYFDDAPPLELNGGDLEALLQSSALPPFDTEITTISPIPSVPPVPVFNGRRALIDLCRAITAESEIRLYKRADNTFFIEIWSRFGESQYIDLPPSICTDAAQAHAAFRTEVKTKYPPVITRGGGYTPIHEEFGPFQATQTRH